MKKPRRVNLEIVEEVVHLLPALILVGVILAAMAEFVYRFAALWWAFL